MSLTLNFGQQSAVDSNSKHILCLAGAGTGKTFTMIERIVKLVNSGVDPKKILVLTFTNAAAFEMRTRHEKRNPGSQPEFRTFHSFCYHILLTDAAVRSALGYSAPPKVMDEATEKRINSYVYQQLGFRTSLNTLLSKESVPSKIAYERDLFLKAKSKRMKLENYLTYDIMSDEITDLFMKQDPLIFSYLNKYTHVFIDEFQDTDPRQWAFVQSFGDSIDIFVVGDALQSIYDFRGADSSIIKSLASDPEWETITLCENYRSTKPICDFANENSTYADSTYRVEIVSDKAGCEVKVAQYSGSYGQLDPTAMWRVDKAILWAMNRGISDIAVLARTNKEVELISEHFQECGIPFYTKHVDSAIDHIFLSIVDTNYMIDWLSSLLDQNQYAEWVRIQTIDPDYKSTFFSKYGSNYKLKPYINKINHVKNIAESSDTVVDKCIKIFQYFKLPVPEDIHEIDPNINAFDYVLSKSAVSVEDGVYIGTIHSVKGLEYDVVFLIGVGSKSFPLTNETNRNLYYVGITRAKSYLFILKDSWRS